VSGTVAGARQSDQLPVHRLDDAFFRSAIESSLDSVRLLDTEGRLLFMNKGSLVGFEIDDVAPLIGRKCRSLWPQHAAKQIARGLEAVRRDETYRFEGQRPTAKGATKWWDVSLAPVHGPGGVLAGIVVTSRDITESVRDHAEAAERELSLARTAATMRSAFEIAHVGGWEVDFVSGQTLFSAELCALLESPPIPAMPSAEAVSFWIEEDRARFQAALDHVERASMRLTFEGRTLARDGSVRWWRLFGEPVLVANRCVALRGVGQDVTDWRGALEREQAAVKAADAMLAFLATMSHELRTPLNGVLGMAQAMSADNLSERQRERLELITTSGELLLTQVNDLLDMSKLDAGQVQLEDGIVDTQSLADEARELFSGLVGDKNLKLKLRLKPSAYGAWRGDPTRVRQILHNLISNAVKFTEHGTIRVDIAHRGKHIVLRVEDTGAGIAPWKQAKIFDRFVQGDASTTRSYGGSGLGLAICRDLVGLMNGSISVESTEGAGAAFIVRLPLVRCRRPDLIPRRAEHDASSTTKLRVLAAEDNATNQIVLKTLLDAVGIEPTMVSNGREAVSAWCKAEFDVVLMDIQMPVMDGIDAVKLIRQGEVVQGRRRLPIIAVTANVLERQKAEYLAAGVDATVAKPIQIASLLETIDGLLARVEQPIGRLSL
jgi:PAS domain S-box-containing protein